MLSVWLILGMGEVIILRAFLLFPATLLCFYSIRFLVLEIFSKAHVFVFSTAHKHAFNIFNSIVPIFLVGFLILSNIFVTVFFNSELIVYLLF